MHLIGQTLIYGGKLLKYLLLDYNSLEIITGPIIFTEPPTNLLISLTNNQLTCLAPDLFYYSTLNGSEITVLKLSNNRLGQQLDHDAQGSTFQHYKHLRRLNLVSNGITQLTRKTFVHNAELQKLHLAMNSLRAITFEFHHMKNLQFLGLSYNLFSTISQDVLRNFSAIISRQGSKFQINLNGNPIECSCDTLEFLRWMQQYKGNLQNFTRYSCLHKGQYVEFSRLSDYIMIDLEFECSIRLALIISGSLLAVALLLVTVSVISYRHRWDIRYACLKLTQRGRRYQMVIDKPVEYTYDGFVVYDNEDRNWVIEQLMPHLEQQHLVAEAETRSDTVINSLRLCVHERDFPPGEHILNNIWSNMERSRKVIVVISKNFTQSHYCNYELNMARMQSVERCHNILVPILLELPDVDRVSTCLHWVLRKLTYIQWPEHGSERDDFWNSLREALNGDVDDHLFRTN